MTVIPMTASPLLVGGAPQVFGLDHTTQNLLDELYRVWVAKQPRNRLRESYLDGKNVLKNLDIAIPNDIAQQLDVVSGWPEKAVYMLAQRCVFDRLVTPDGGDDPLGLAEVLEANRFRVEFPQAVVSSMAHSTAFIETTPGRDSSEPAVLVMMHSAIWSAGLWSRTKRSMRGFLAINDVDRLGQPVLMTLSTPFEVLVLRKGTSWFLDDRVPLRIGRVPVEPLPFRPTLTRPFGRSRISRQVMSLTDRAMRAAARLDMGGELHSAPKYMLLGADEDLFKDANGNPIPKWTWYLTRMNTISRDEDNQLPEVEKIAAESPEPHIATKRALAAEFSGVTGVPLASLGVSTDNPSSAQAIDEVREDLIIDADEAITVYKFAVKRTAQNVVMLRDRLDSVPDEAVSLSANFKSPRKPSIVSQSDAMVKQVSAIPWLAESVVALEELGYSEDQITRLLADKRRAQGGSLLNRVLAQPAPVSAPDGVAD